MRPSGVLILGMHETGCGKGAFRACSMSAVATLGLVGPRACSRMDTAALHSGSASLYLRANFHASRVCTTL